MTKDSLKWLNDLLFCLIDQRLYAFDIDNDNDDLRKILTPIGLILIL